MKLKDLKYLVAVDTYQHFGKAAEACFVSQPALSMQIMKLEASLGIQLIERTNKSVKLTDYGKEISQRARKILAEVDDIKEIANTAKDPFSGELRLGIFPTLAPYLLPHIMPALKKHYPKLSLYLIEEKTPVLIEQLKSTQLHAAILAMPIQENTFTHYPLFEEKFLLAAHKGHPLAKLNKIHAKQLEDETLLLLDEGHCLRDQALSVCHRLHASENQHFRATSLETLRHMISTGLGMTLMPQLACVPQRDLVYIPFANVSPSRRIALYSRKQSAKTPLLDDLSKLITLTLSKKQ